MPSYRFILKVSEDQAGQAEEFGLFNDEGAIQYARRLSPNHIVEVWQDSRLVGRVEPNVIAAPTLEVAVPAD